MAYLKFALLAAALLLGGCIAGKATMFAPVAGPNAQYACGTATIRPDDFFSDGFVVLYYIVPLVPVPNASETESSLEFPITIHSEVEPVFDLTVQDVSVRIPNVQKAVHPIKVELIVNVEKPWYYKTFKFTFDVDRHQLNEFVLIFAKPLHGCDIPDTPYVKKEETHYITPGNR